MRPDPHEYLLNKRSAVIWVENTIGEPLEKDEDFFSQLVDGVTLCKVMQRISPSLIPRIKIPVIKRRASHFVFKTNENVSFFLQACVEIGVPRHRRFVLHDLVHTQKKEVISYASAKRILDCLETLCEVANKYGKLYDFSIKWPVLDKEKEKFTKDELVAAELLVEQYVRTERQKVEGLKNHTDQKPQDDPRKLDRYSQMELLKKQEEEKANKAATRLQALVKGWIARTKFRSMVLHQAYRDKVAHEILATERVYVEHLEFTFKQLLVPLRQSLENSSPILTENEIRAIFGETEVILNYNKLLLAQLEPRVAKWNVLQCLGDIFLQIVGFLKIYSQYVSNYGEAMRVLGECKQQSKFKKFLDEIKKKNSDLEQRGLEDFLIRPVQRIPRYFLLLQDLVRHTAPDHPDYANLASAAQKVQAVAEYMNEKKREAENIMKVTEIQEMITFEEEFETLAKPSRRFVKEAQMQEIGKGTTKKLTVVAFLFNDLLVITKSCGSSFLSRNKAPKLVFQTSFRLPGSKIISLDDTAAFQNGFVFLRPTSKRSVTLLASSKEARDEWVSCIEAEIAGATQQEEAQDMRITNMVADKVNEAKLRLEKQMSSVVDMHRKLSLSLDEEAATSALSNLSSLSPSSDSDDGKPRSNSVKGSSLREKRIALMNQARKNSTGGSGKFTFAVSSEDPA